MNYAVDLNVRPVPKIGGTIDATQSRTEIKVEGALNVFPPVSVQARLTRLSSKQKPSLKVPLASTAVP